jgi:hypothetical protein
MRRNTVAGLLKATSIGSTEGVASSDGRPLSY